MISFFIFACGQDPILERMEDETESLDTIAEETVSEKPTENSLSPPLPVQPREDLVPPKPTQPKEISTISPGQPSSEPPPGVPSSEPTPGQPSAEPTPGIPTAPAPGNPFKDGPLVKLSGRVTVPNWNGAPIRIDIFDGDQRQIGGQRPNVVMMEYLNSDGDFEIEIPERDTPYWIGAYVDIDQDGKPGANDPSAWYPGNPIMGNTDTSGVLLELSVLEDNRK